MFLPKGNPPFLTMAWSLKDTSERNGNILLTTKISSTLIVAGHFFLEWFLACAGYEVVHAYHKNIKKTATRNTRNTYNFIHNLKTLPE